MMRVLILFLLLAGGAAAADREPPLEQFASGYRLVTGGEAAIYRLPLPAPVYRTVVRRDLGDIRVFNAAGERVPHAVRRPDAVERRTEANVELPLFPVGGDMENAGQGSAVDVMVADDGSIIRLVPRQGAVVAETAAVPAYIIDMSRLDRTVDELEFDLAGGEGAYIRRIALEYSNDLNSWHSLVGDATLARLDYGGRSLHKNTVKLPNRRSKYLRIHWLDDAGGLQIKRVRATLNTVHSSRDRSWSEVDGSVSSGNENTYDFDTRGVFPVDRANVVLPEDNTLIEAVLRSRPDPGVPWRTRYSGLFYALRVKGSQLESGPVSLEPRPDRYWQLQVKTRDGLGARPPKLRFAWVPNDLYFLARGEGPYTLAFGNGRIGPPGRPIEALMNVLGDDQAAALTGVAQTGKAVSLMGKRALKPELSIPWERILLWGVLVVGVVVIAVMAMRQFRQLNAGE